MKRKLQPWFGSQTTTQKHHHSRRNTTDAAQRTQHTLHTAPPALARPRTREGRAPPAPLRERLCARGGVSELALEERAPEGVVCGQEAQLAARARHRLENQGDGTEKKQKVTRTKLSVSAKETTQRARADPWPGTQHEGLYEKCMRDAVSALFCSVPYPHRERFVVQEAQAEAADLRWEGQERRRGRTAGEDARGLEEAANELVLRIHG